jgi:hypothetical protein
MLYSHDYNPGGLVCGGIRIRLPLATSPLCLELTQEILFIHQHYTKWVVRIINYIPIYTHQLTYPLANKPRGLQAARSLRTSRRENRWADKNYKKRALGKFYKTSPTGGTSHAKGIVLEKVSGFYVVLRIGEIRTRGNLGI